MVHIKNTLKTNKQTNRDLHGFPFPLSFPIISGELLQDKVEEELSQRLTEAPLLFFSKLLGCQFTLGHPSIIGLPWGLVGKESNAMQETGLIPGLGRSAGDGKGSPLQYSGLEEFMDYSSWGRQESDKTE